MKKRWNTLAIMLAVGLTGLLLVVGGCRPREAGERMAGREPGEEAPAEQVAEGKERLVMPAEENMVAVWATYPEDFRVGEAFGYEIHVKNLSERVLLHEVTIRQLLPGGFAIDSAEPAVAEEQEMREEPRPQQAEEKQEPAAKEKPDAKQQEQRPGRTVAWTIRNLPPGETRTIHVRATADQEGTLTTCLTVSYTPALCLTAKVVKPVVGVVKMVPEAAGICDVLVFRYRIVNTGSGATRPLMLVDNLPDGLKTTEGQDVIRIPLDPLAPGEEKAFEARLVAHKQGEFASRAVVVDREDENKIVARSALAKARVLVPRLKLELNGPQAEYVGDRMTYTAVVTNVGEVPARDGRLTLRFDPRLGRLLGAGRPVFEGGEEDEDEVFDAEIGDPTAENAMQTLTWRLDDLVPGESGRVRVTLVGRERGQVEVRAVAGFECAAAGEFIETRVVRVLQTELIALPALLIGVIDTPDPVPVGEEVAYDVVVGNEGTAADNNIRVALELPEQLEFVRGEGVTGVQGEGRNVTIASLDRLAPGDDARWRILTRATSAGDVRFKIRVTSDYLTQPATAEEPTRIFSTEKPAATAKPEATATPPVAKPEDKEAAEKSQPTPAKEKPAAKPEEKAGPPVVRPEEQEAAKQETSKEETEAEAKPEAKPEAKEKPEAKSEEKAKVPVARPEEELR